MSIFGRDTCSYEGLPGLLPRRKVFISYYKGDKDWVDKLVADYGQPGSGVFIPRVVGVKDEDDFVDSTDPEYIISQIRKRYIQDTSVTIVVIGQCTHSRRYVDWEIKSSLRQAANGIPNGLLGLEVPQPLGIYGAPVGYHLPDRFYKNYNRSYKDLSYSRYYRWPGRAEELRLWIEEVYNLSLSKAYLINNPQTIVRRNMLCRVHNITHTL